MPQPVDLTFTHGGVPLRAATSKVLVEFRPPLHGSLDDCLDVMVHRYVPGHEERYIGWIVAPNLGNPDWRTNAVVGQEPVEGDLPDLMTWIAQAAHRHAEEIT